ncbi:MAG: hypothetical protein QOH83_505 [Solirubrobacteraceae bacterium]|jgi:hypothetical protein|nr:hypothetical protein [Solirubrobacteraceae bacterium]
MRSIRRWFVQLENVIHRELIVHSTDLLRVAFGAVFLGFGVLKFFPGVSPAESLVIATADKLTLGLVPGHAALVVIATLECFIGVCMLAGRWMRLAIWLLALQFVGILAPLVLPARALVQRPASRADAGRPVRPQGRDPRRSRHGHRSRHLPRRPAGPRRALPEPVTRGWALRSRRGASRVRA